MPNQAPLKKTTTSKPPSKAVVKAPHNSLTRPAPTSVARTNSKPASQAPKPQQQAPPNGNWINRAVQNKVAGVGNMAGGLINSVGNGVNAVGEGIGKSITNTTRYWGQGVAGYGNDIKDAVGAGGSRVATAGNPLGLGGVGQSKGLLPGGKLPAGQGVRNSGKGGGSNPLGLS